MVKPTLKFESKEDIYSIRSSVRLNKLGKKSSNQIGVAGNRDSAIMGKKKLIFLIL